MGYCKRIDLPVQPSGRNCSQGGLWTPWLLTSRAYAPMGSLSSFRTLLRLLIAVVDSGRDTLDGSAYFGSVTLLGNSGDDVIRVARNDLVLGGDGDDSIWGGDGKDTLAGQAGDEDRLFDATAAEIDEVFTFDDHFLFV